jgi:hypothetical protein
VKSLGTLCHNLERSLDERFLLRVLPFILSISLRRYLSFTFLVHRVSRPLIILLEGPNTPLLFAMATCWSYQSSELLMGTGPPVYLDPCSNDSSQTTTCCVHGDQCLGDGFCHFSHTDTASVSGYYIGGCTDSNFPDPPCSKQCSKFAHPPLVPTRLTRLFLCSGTSHGRCLLQPEYKLVAMLLWRWNS